MKAGGATASVSHTGLPLGREGFDGKNNGLIGLYKGDEILPSYIGGLYTTQLYRGWYWLIFRLCGDGWGETKMARCDRPPLVAGGARGPRQQWSVENVAIEGLPLCVVPCLCSGLCGSGIGTTPRRSMLRRWSGVRTVVGITWCPWCTDGTWLAWGQGLTFPSLVSLLRGGRSAAQARSCSHWKGKEKGDDTTQLCGDYTNY